MLYLSFAYVVFAIVLLLVVGRKGLGVYEWGGLTGAPILFVPLAFCLNIMLTSCSIYLTRRLLGAFYSYRIESISSRLKELQDERGSTIQKLKDATKYDSTLELIEKYGGAEGGPKKSPSGKKGKGKDGDEAQNGRGDESKGQAMPVPGRTNMPPPPTANIARRQSAAPNSPLEPNAEFAPNADFADHTAYPLNSPGGPSLVPSGGPVVTHENHWYDRILDTLLGEDETSPKNRIALICQSCRLVNGLAPPGTTSLVEIGPWRCGSCHAMNNEKQDVIESVKSGPSPVTADPESEAETVDSEIMVDTVDTDSPASTVKRRRAKAAQ